MRIVVQVLFIIAIVLGMSSEILRPAARVTAAPEPQTYIPPIITVWYGDEQYFTNGSPQNFINIVGNVNGGDPNHKWLGIKTLRYTLNNSLPRDLAIGEGIRRLAKAGDFNIDISLDDPFLWNGRNTVSITATNQATAPQTSTRTIFFTYDRTKTWELPYTVDWSTMTNLQNSVQVVDGHWRVENGGLRTVETGYDRVLAIGERSWTNYQVLVSFTVHSLDNWVDIPNYSQSPGVGVNLRWLGHTEDPPGSNTYCTQVLCYWEPTGVSNWYELWMEKPSDPAWVPPPDRFKLLAKPPDSPIPYNLIDLQMGKKYWLRASAESNPVGTLYRSKLWLDGTPEPGWMLEKQTDSTNLSHGSFLLVAHHADVTFHHIAAIPIQGSKKEQTIQITKHAPSSLMTGVTFTVSAIATSGLPVTITSGSPDVCAYQNGIFTVIRSGSSCIVQYAQAGNASYYPAPIVQEITRTGYLHYIPSIRR